MRIYLFILLFGGLLEVSCENKHDSQSSSFYPSNTLIATVNGTWVGTGTYIYTPQKVSFSGNILSISAALDPGCTCSCTSEYIGIYLYVKRTGNYSIPGLTNNYAFIEQAGSCSPNIISFSTDSTHTGTINITNLDTINHVVSGTFSFTANMTQPTRNDGTVLVTNGIINKVTW